MLITGVEPKSTGSPTLSVGTVLVQCKGTFSSQLRNMVLRFYFPERRSGQFYSFQIAKRKTASSRPICIPLLRNLSCKTRYPSAADDPSIFGKFINHFNVKSSTVFELGTGTFIMIKLIFLLFKQQTISKCWLQLRHNGQTEWSETKTTKNHNMGNKALKLRGLLGKMPF